MILCFGLNFEYDDELSVNSVMIYGPSSDIGIWMLGYHCISCLTMCLAVRLNLAFSRMCYNILCKSETMWWA